MRIGIIGSGVVAQTLGGGFLKHGHDFVLGTREPAKLAAWTQANPRGRVGSSADAAKFAELAVLAVKGTVAAEAVRAAGPANLAGKPVIDAANPIADINFPIQDMIPAPCTQRTTLPSFKSNREPCTGQVTTVPLSFPFASIPFMCGQRPAAA